jgi:TatD DNase family protein
MEKPLTAQLSPQISAPYIDTHAHYDDERFDSDRDELLQRLHKNGAKKIINIGCNLERTKASADLAARFDFVSFAAGIHPQDVLTLPKDYTRTLSAFAKMSKCVAVGEIGLEYYGEFADKKIQERIFREQIELARDFNLPVIIHSRDAAADTIEILRDYAPLKGQMHCFSYSKESAEIFLKMGLHISFTGVLTFKNAKKAIEALSVVPLSKLLTETDCPYMAPEPVRGTRNDSGNIPFIIEKIAELKGETTEKIAEITVENAEGLFFQR